MKVLRTASYLLFGGLIWLVSLAVLGDERPVLRLGMMAFDVNGVKTTHIPAEDVILKELPLLLQKSLPNYQIRPEIYRTATLVQKVKENKVDLVFCSSGAFASMLPMGVLPIATLTTPEAPDPNSAVAGALVVRSDRDDLATIADLRGLRAIGGLESMFFNYQMPMSAVAEAGYDPDTFFSKLDKVDNPRFRVLNALDAGTHDVGLLRACVLENLSKEISSRYKVIGARTGSALKCAHSSDVFPNWTVGATASVPPNVTKEVAKTLLQTSGNNGIEWSVANSFSKIDLMYRTLKIGPYEELRDWNLNRLWKEYWGYFLAVLLFSAALILHSLRARHLVEQRTRELREQIRENERLEILAARFSKKYDALQRAGTISFLSNILAHEIKQPLATVAYLNKTSEMILEKEKIDNPLLQKTVSGVKRQVEKIDSIIAKVRSYAQSGTQRNFEVNLAQTFREAWAECEHSKDFSAELVRQEIDDKAVVLGEPLELLTVFLNLLRNASEAAENSNNSHAQISIEIRRDGNQAAVVIEELCSPIADDVYAKIKNNEIVSSKKDGMGFGLQIVRNIIEQHGGRLWFEKTESWTLKVIFRLFLSGGHEA